MKMHASGILHMLQVMWTIEPDAPAEPYQRVRHLQQINSAHVHGAQQLLLAFSKVRGSVNAYVSVQHSMAHALGTHVACICRTTTNLTAAVTILHCRHNCCNR